MIGIEQQLKEYETQLLNNNPSKRQIAELRELHAQLDDYYDDIQEDISEGSINLDESVIVKVDGTTLKFSDIDKAAEFINDHIRR